MINKQARSVFESDNGKYKEVLGLSSCMVGNFSRLLAHSESPDINELGDGTTIRSSVDEKSLFVTEYQEDGVSAVEAANARIILPQGKSIRIARSSLDDEERSDKQITGEALFSLETGDGGLHLGRTFYLLGDAAVEGAVLRPKTDHDISLLEEFAKGYSRSNLAAQPGDQPAPSRLAPIASLIDPQGPPATVHIG